LLLQFLLAPRERTPAPAAARAHPRRRLGQTVAALHARHARGTDGSRLDATGGAAVSGAAVAAARGGVSQAWWWEAAREERLRWRRASAWLASRASPGLRGSLESHESPLV